MLWHVLVILFWCFSGPIFGDCWPQVGKAELFKIELSLWRRAHFAQFRCLLAGWRLAVNLVAFWEGFGLPRWVKMWPSWAKLGPKLGQVRASEGYVGASCADVGGKVGEDLGHVGQDRIKEGPLLGTCVGPSRPK